MPDFLVPILDELESSYTTEAITVSDMLETIASNDDPTMQTPEYLAGCLEELISYAQTTLRKIRQLTDAEPPTHRVAFTVTMPIEIDAAGIASPDTALAEQYATAFVQQSLALRYANGVDLPDDAPDALRDYAIRRYGPLTIRREMPTDQG